MPTNDKPILVYATFPDTNSAEMVGEALVDQALAACINILPGMVSIYIWDGKRQRDQEVVMIAKTRRLLLERVVRLIKARHPSKTPAVVTLDISGGSTDFLRWIDAQTAERKIS